MCVMTDSPYHHGHLRATLLAEAERTVREQGIAALVTSGRAQPAQADSLITDAVSLFAPQPSS